MWNPKKTRPSFKRSERPASYDISEMSYEEKEKQISRHLDANGNLPEKERTRRYEAIRQHRIELGLPESTWPDNLDPSQNLMGLRPDELGELLNFNTDTLDQDLYQEMVISSVLSQVRKAMVEEYDKQRSQTTIADDRKAVAVVEPKIEDAAVESNGGEIRSAKPDIADFFFGK